MPVIEVLGVQYPKSRIQSIRRGFFLHLNPPRFCRLLPLVIVLMMHAILPEVLAVVSQEEQIFTVGIKAYQDGLYDLAMQEFQRLERNYPQSERIPIARFFLGEIFLQKNSHDRAATKYTEVMNAGNTTPYYVDALYRLGEIFVKEKKYDKAREYFEKLHDETKDPKMLAKTYFWLGEIFYNREEFGQAIEQYKKSLTADSRGEYSDYACYSLGWAYHKMGIPDKTIAYFDRLLQEYPDSSLKKSVVPLKRKSLFTLHKYSDVIGVCMEELKTSQGREREEIWLMLAESHYQIKNFERALESYTTYLHEFPDGSLKAQCLLGKAWSLLELEKSVEARATFQTFTVQFPEHSKTAESYFAIASISLKINDDEMFLKTCDYILKNYPGSPVAEETMFRVGVFHRNEERYNDALIAFQKLISDYPESPYVESSKFFIGDCYRELKEFDKAIETFRQFYEQSEDTTWKAQALFQMGSCYYLNQEYSEARSIFEEIRTTYSQIEIAEDASIWLAETLFSLDDPDGSRAVYSELLDHANDIRKEEIHYKIAEISFLEEKWSKTIEDYQKFVREFPQSKNVAKAFFRMGIASFKLGDNISGIGFLQQYLNSSPDEAKEEEAYYRVGRQLFEQGDLEKSIFYYKEYLKRFQNGKHLNEVNYELSLCYMGSGYYREALGILSRTLENVFDKDLKNRILYNIGVCYARLDDTNLAIEKFHQVIQSKERDDVYFKALLEISLMQYGRGEYSQAIAGLKQITQSNYQDIKAIACHKLAQHYYSINNEDKAISYLKIAIQFSKLGSLINHQAYSQLGEIYEKRREWGKALEAYLYAKETARDEATKQNFEKKIKQMKELGALP